MNLKIFSMTCGAVTISNETVLFSYGVPIVKLSGGTIVKVYKDWDYSTTTSKHLNSFLNEYGLGNIAKMPRAQKRKYFESQGLL